MGTSIRDTTLFRGIPLQGSDWHSWLEDCWGRGIFSVSLSPQAEWELWWSGECGEMVHRTISATSLRCLGRYRREQQVWGTFRGWSSATRGRSQVTHCPLWGKCSFWTGLTPALHQKGLGRLQEDCEIPMVSVRSHNHTPELLHLYSGNTDIYHRLSS